ncbi:MAG: hypothetical protein PHQ88_09065 [Bacteroides sp.]|nr:hypothetical protein [Bacteroides sp.]
MEVENINVNTSGFLKAAEYSFQMYPLLSNYKNSFGNAEFLILNIEEHPSIISFTDKKQYEFTEDGKKVEINISFSKSYNTKGKETGQPSAKDVYECVGYVLDNVVFKYYSQFGFKIEKRFTEYDNGDLERLKYKTLLFCIGNKDTSSKFNKFIVGEIVDYKLASNPPYLPFLIEIESFGQYVEKFNILEVKEIHEIKLEK